FTLIELLAVLVILVVIAAIATPIVMGIINDAKESAARSSADGFIDTVESTLALAMIEDFMFKSEDTWTVAADGATLNGANGESISVSINGNFPNEGSTVTFDDEGVMTAATIKYDDYTVTYADGEFTDSFESDNTAA
ncbi:MAG: prepilin-type N-terminal cleavage/methylation domain-containing protein, partial [Mycoplasmatota bacterium]